MTWTVVDDEHNVIHVRAILNVKTEEKELRKLIAALEARLAKEVLSNE